MGDTTKPFILFLIGFLIVFSFLSFFIQIETPNTVQRESAAMLLKDFVLQNPVSLLLHGKIISTFASYYNHYSIFTGFTEWPPLQIVILGTMYFLFGLNDFTPFLFSILSLFLLSFVYFKYFSLFTKNKLVIYSSFALFLLSPLVLFSLFSTNTDLGMTIFLLSILYFFFIYITKNDKKSLFLLALIWGIGALYKFEIIALALPMIIAYFIYHRKNISSLFSKKYLIQYLIAAAIFFVIICVHLIPQLYLMQYNLSSLLGRFSHWGIAQSPTTNPSSYPFLTPKDYHFPYEQSSFVQMAIAHRFDFTFFQKLFVTLSSLFYQWFLLPLFLFFIIRITRKHERFSKKQRLHMLISFVTTGCFVFLFSYIHVLPRYIIIILPFIIFFSIHSLCFLKKKHFVIIFTLLLLLTIIQSSLFLNKIEQGRHASSFQHNFNGAIEFVLHDLEINNISQAGVATSWIKYFAHAAIPLDKNKQLYLLYLPDNRNDFLKLLSTEEKNNEFLLSRNTDLLELIKQPPVEYILIMEGFESSPDFSSTPFNKVDYLSSDNNFALLTTIPSGNIYNNTRIFIYKRMN